jgi:hypothetical protein
VTGMRLANSLTAGLIGLLLASPVSAVETAATQANFGPRLRLSPPKLLAQSPTEPPASPDASESSEEPAPTPVDPRPATLDYTPGQPIPPGYSVASGVTKAYLIPGAIVFGISYSISAILAASRTEASATAESFLQVPFDPRWLYVPVIGPWGALVTSFMSHDCRNSYYTSSYFYGQCEAATGPENLDLWRTLLVMDGIAQGAGVALAIYGIKRRWYQLVLTNDWWATLQPVPMGRAGQGLALLGGFRGL